METKARLIAVIEVKCTIGSGIENDPYREVVEYYLPDGTKIGWVDPAKPLA